MYKRQTDIWPINEKQQFFNQILGCTFVDEAGENKTLVTVTQEDIDAWGCDGEPQEGVVGLAEFLKNGCYTCLLYTSISPLDCMGCGVCVNVCPSDSLAMVDTDTQLAQQEVFDWCVDNVAEKPELADATVKGSQFKQPCLLYTSRCV